MSDQIKVTIGDAEVPIPPFRGFKAIRAGRILARVSEKVQELTVKADDYAEDFGSKHTMRITREMANFRGWVHIQFPTAEELPDGVEPSGQDFIEVPRMPDDNQKFLEVFKEAFEMIETEATQLLALLLAPNEDLERAFENEADGGVDGYLEREAQRLLFKANLGQLADVAIAGKDVLQREFEGKMEALSDLRSLVGQQSPSRDSDETTVEGSAQETPTPDSIPTPEDPESTQTSEAHPDSESASQKTPEAPQESESESSSSSTSSDAPTDGPDETSSLVSPGSNSETSKVG